MTIKVITKCIDFSLMYEFSKFHTHKLCHIKFTDFFYSVSLLCHYWLSNRFQDTKKIRNNNNKSNN